jgi:hypothetical protein
MTAYASYSDANAWVDETKIKFIDDTDAAPEAQNAEKIINASLVPIYGATVVATWSTATPTLVNEIAALLMASFRYAKKYSEEGLNPSDYAQRLEDRALSMLAGLQDGSMVLVDYPNETSLTAFTESDFYPNNTIEDPGTDRASKMDSLSRKFGMGKIF